MDAAVELVEHFDPVDSATPGHARRAAQSFARQRIADDATIQAIASCVTEAVTNVLLHAYRDQPTPGPAILEAKFTGARLRIRVSDRGTGLTPRVDSPGFGLGMPLISQLTDEADFRTRKRGGTEVTMHFRVA